MHSDDEQMMRRAIEIAQRGKGHVSPNPLVGCVITLDGVVIGEGAHLKYGEGHAEKNAILDAESKGLDVKGATCYVTLEPCAHHGKTGPCADLLIKKQIARCVIAVRDPFKEVDGKGIAKLQSAGIAVELGMLEQEAREMNRFWLNFVERGVPYVTLKLAQSLDARSALNSGESRWITGEHSRRAVHQMRAEYDAVMIGTGTALADDPELTVRDVKGRNPLRVVLDTQQRLPNSLRVFSTEAAPTIVVTSENDNSAKREKLVQKGVKLLDAPLSGVSLDMKATLRLLAKEGIASVMVEAGPRLASSLIKQDLVDELAIFIAPKFMGADSRPSVGNLGLEGIEDTPRWTLHGHEVFPDGDIYLRYRPT